MPARFNILVLLSIAVLAGVGLDRVLRRWSILANPVAVGLCFAVLGTEYYSSPLFVTQTRQVPLVYEVLRSFPVGVVAEFPMPLVEKLPGPDPEYQFESIWHWRSLINGYSGYYPRSYMRLLETVRTFPEGEWIQALRSYGARYVIIHGSELSDQASSRALFRLIASGATPYGPFGRREGRDWLVDLTPSHAESK